jgi:hypothetical protein
MISPEEFADAKAALDRWAAEHNEMLAARARPGFWAWVRGEHAVAVQHRRAFKGRKAKATDAELRAELEALNGQLRRYGGSELPLTGEEGKYALIGDKFEMSWETVKNRFSQAKAKKKAKGVK